GHYAADSGYLAKSSYTSYPLHALANGLDGADGVYTLGSGTLFPTSTNSSTNYWVDAVFNTTATDTTPPGVINETPAPCATSIGTGTTLTAAFNESIKSGTISFVLRDASNNVVPSTVSYSDTTLTATLTPSALLANSTTYTATVSGATDQAGNVMSAPASWSFTT